MAASYTTLHPSTAPSPQTPSSGAAFSSSANQIRRSISAALRPWSELLDLSAFSLPVPFSESSFRIRVNLFRFRVNYAIIALLILFLSLIYHPISIIVFLITLVAWIFLYFARDEPLTVFDRSVDDRIVLILLSIFTIVALIWTSVWSNLIISLVISGVVILLHAALRAPDDVDDQESPYGALLSVVDSPRGAYSQV